MQVPPEIAFRGLEPTDSLKDLILEGIEKLEKVYPNLISCRTVVADDTPGRHSGQTYRVRLELGIPNHTVIVDKSDPDSIEHKDVGQAIREAFSIARKRLLEMKERQRGEENIQELPPHGRITRLLMDDTGVRYGFLESQEGRQIYFHEEALVDVDYDDLEVGDEVRYAAAEGDEGPQASTVAPLDPHRIGPVKERSIPLKEDPRS